MSNLLTNSLPYKYQTLIESNDKPNEKSQYCVEYDSTYKIGGPDFWNYEDDLIDWVVNDKPTSLNMQWFQPVYDEVYKTHQLERLNNSKGEQNIKIRDNFIGQYNNMKREMLSIESVKLLEDAKDYSLSNLEFIDIMMKLPWETRVVIGI